MATLLAVALLGLVATPAAAVGKAASIVDVGSYTYAFSPVSLTVHVGDRITWTNKSVAPHNVTFASFGSPSSMTTGATYSHTFGTAGTFRYTCTIHGFSGKVVVVANATPKPTPRPTPRPTPKPTPKPTARPTPASTAAPTVAPTPSSASPSPVAAAVPSTAIAPSSAPIAYGASGTPPSGSAGDTGGLALPIVLGLVGVGIVALGAIVLRRR